MISLFEMLIKGFVIVGLPYFKAAGILAAYDAVWLTATVIDVKRPILFSESAVF